jgi:hypothetical protein
MAEEQSNKSKFINKDVIIEQVTLALVKRS